jgi:hypothetical protein
VLFPVRGGWELEDGNRPAWFLQIPSFSVICYTHSQILG